MENKNFISSYISNFYIISNSVNKKVDFIICNIEEIKKYTKTFIKDSIYINKDMLYIYNIKDEELKQELIKKYKRYSTIVEEIKDNETTILKIDNKNSKTNIFKDTFYLIIDTSIQLFNIISDLLLNQKGIP